MWTLPRRLVFDIKTTFFDNAPPDGRGLSKWSTHELSECVSGTLQVLPSSTSHFVWASFIVHRARYHLQSRAQYHVCTSGCNVRGIITSDEWRRVFPLRAAGHSVYATHARMAKCEGVRVRERGVSACVRWHQAFVPAPVAKSVIASISQLASFTGPPECRPPRTRAWQILSLADVHESSQCVG